MGGTRLGQGEARHGVTGGRFGLIAVGIGLVSIGFSGVISQAAALLLVAPPDHPFVDRAKASGFEIGFHCSSCDL